MLSGMLPGLLATLLLSTNPRPACSHTDMNNCDCPHESLHYLLIKCLPAALNLGPPSLASRGKGSPGEKEVKGKGGGKGGKGKAGSAACSEPHLPADTLLLTHLLPDHAPACRVCKVVVVVVADEGLRVLCCQLLQVLCVCHACSIQPYMRQSLVESITHLYQSHHCQHCHIHADSHSQYHNLISSMLRTTTSPAGSLYVC